VANPNRALVPYFGYTANSFSPPLPEGTMSPLYLLELRQGGVWKARGIGWCGTGIGNVALPPRGKVTFTVVPPAGRWDALKVGLRWRSSAERKGPWQTAWSDPVSARAATAPR
jgi:hypothetical protein